MASKTTKVYLAENEYMTVCWMTDAEIAKAKARGARVYKHRGFRLI